MQGASVQLSNPRAGRSHNSLPVRTAKLNLEIIFIHWLRPLTKPFASEPAKERARKLHLFDGAASSLVEEVAQAALAETTTTPDNNIALAANERC